MSARSVIPPTLMRDITAVTAPETLFAMHHPGLQGEHFKGLVNLEDSSNG